MKRCGVVYLVGAGPGDPGLITVRGAQLIHNADVIVFDRLIGKELLLDTRPGVEFVDVGKKPGQPSMKQPQINDLLIERARASCHVVRLKGGDPFVFGRGFEELSACRVAGVPCVVIPGVSSAIAAPAAVGIPVTARHKVRSVAIITGSTASNDPSPEIDYSALAMMDTIVILMGRANLGQIVQSLINAGKSPTLPAACIEKATMPQQRVVVATLETIADEADRQEIQAPMVAVIGEVAAEATSDEALLQSFGFDLDGDMNSLYGESLAMSRPLAGKRIVITRPSSVSNDLQARLSAEGATIIPCPLISIEYPQDISDSHEVFERLGEYDWIVFTSMHGVLGFWKQLIAQGLDARALAKCKLAVVGPRTLTALTDQGIQVDLIPQVHDAKSLANEMIQQHGETLKRVLFAKGDLALDTLPAALKHAGVAVDEIVVYHTVDISPPEISRLALEDGADAIMFFSPSALQRYVSLDLPTKDTIIACIGPTTAEAAVMVGLTAHVVAQDHTARGLIEALLAYFTQSGVQSS